MTFSYTGRLVKSCWYSLAADVYVGPCLVLKKLRGKSNYAAKESDARENARENIYNL